MSSLVVWWWMIADEDHGHSGLHASAWLVLPINNKRLAGYKPLKVIQIVLFDIEFVCNYHIVVIWFICFVCETLLVWSRCKDLVFVVELVVAWQVDASSE